MEALAINTGAPTVHLEDITTLYTLLNLKGLLLGSNIFIFLSTLYNNNLTMVCLFPNMRILVSLCQLCAPNHVQVQLSVILINWRLGLYCIHTLKHNKNN